MTKQSDELAALRAEIEALKAAQPKPEPSAEERERARLKWIDEMHQMREGRMANATRPQQSATGRSSTTISSRGSHYVTPAHQPAHRRRARSRARNT